MLKYLEACGDTDGMGGDTLQLLFQSVFRLKVKLYRMELWRRYVGHHVIL